MSSRVASDDEAWRAHTAFKGRAATLITATRELDLRHAEIMRGMLQRKGATR